MIRTNPGGEINTEYRRYLKNAICVIDMEYRNCDDEEPLLKLVSRVLLLQSQEIQEEKAAIFQHSPYLSQPQNSTILSK